MATKTKITKTTTNRPITGFTPVILAAITVTLALITGCEIMAYTQLSSDLSKNTNAVKCTTIEGHENLCDDMTLSVELGDVTARSQAQSYHVAIVTLVAATLISAAIDVSYISLMRK